MLHEQAEALGGHSYRHLEAASLVSALAEPLGRRLYSHSLTLRLASESAERRDCRLDRRSRAAWMLSAHPAFLRRRLIRYYRPIFLPRPAFERRLGVRIFFSSDFFEVKVSGSYGVVRYPKTPS